MNNRDYQKTNIMKTMVGLMQELQKLKPHPDRPGFKGALFVSLPGWCHVPGEHDALPGMLLAESMLSSAFAGTQGSANDCTFTPSDAANALDLYETYRTEIEGSIEKKAAHGQGTLARLSGQPIKNSFNLRSSINTAMQAFLDDLPARMSIERQLAASLKQLNALNTPAPSVRAA